MPDFGMTLAKSPIRAITALFLAFGLSARTEAPKYAEGQVWEYKAREQDRGSLLKLQRIAPYGADKVYHISITGVRFQQPGLHGGLPHIPVSQATLDASVTKRSRSRAAFPTTAADDGIAEWKRAEGGVFTITVAEIVGIIDDQTRQAAVGGGG